MSRSVPLLAAVCFLAGAVPAPLAGQSSPAAEMWVGSEVERYLRVLQTAGEVPLHPWGIRGFSPGQVEALLPRGDHPWETRYAAPAPDPPSTSLTVLPVEAAARYNTGFPYGYNDGAVWAGRGMTVQGSAGVALRAGPLSVRVAPTAFWAENRAFPLIPTGRPGALEFAHPDARTDQPQRFGDRPYARIDPGQSHVRLDVIGLAAGLSTENAGWGPGIQQPIILGHNAPGFAHAFAGTSSPLNVGVGHLHGRVLWGRLEQSDYSPAHAGTEVRFMTAGVASFSPRGLPGLELGATRFFHVRWREGGPRLRDVVKLFEAIPQAPLRDDPEGYDGSLDNQLASVFFRWVLPAAGVEVYGEYGREDHNWDMLDFLLEPDHHAAFLVGGQKVWTRDDRRRVVLRAELLNSQRPHLVRGRGQSPFYGHHALRQGHTHRGQVLGAPFGHGGGGGSAGVDVYGPAGRWSVQYLRGRRGDDWTYWLDGEVSTGRTDVVHSLGADGVLFRGRADVTWGAGAVYNLNRNFGDDAVNLNASLGLRFRP